VAGFSMGLGVQPDSITWFEYNNDGDDLTWEKHYIDISHINGPGDISLKDMNHDGVLDVVTVSYMDDEIYWYENKLAGNQALE
jgi:hypothetical protein